MYSSKCFGICVIIRTFVVRCLNIEETTFVKILEKENVPVYYQIKSFIKRYLSIVLLDELSK